MTAMKFLKGHGTENDFVILPGVPDPEQLAPETVRLLCDRRAGIGADGVLGVVRRQDGFFMDYRNVDGSTAEMCGNGVRVFAHYLVSRGLVERDEPLTVLTRDGEKRVTVHQATATDATVSVEMGTPEVLGVSTCEIDGQKFAGLAVSVGNPHLACVIPGMDAAELAGLRVGATPKFDEAFFPHGVNVEIATELAADGVAMRVHERGAGETRSCGTGTVATAVAALADAGKEDGTVEVTVPGGKVEVTLQDGRATLTGPSKIVAEGSFLVG